MNRITRMLTMSGLGLLAGATMIAGPATASAGTGQGATQSSSSAGQASSAHRDHVAGVYRSYRACVIAGRIGERLDRWEDFDCERRGFGFRTRFVLEVEYDNDWWGHGRPHHGRPWHHGGGFRPHHGGGFRPFPGHVRPRPFPGRPFPDRPVPLPVPIPVPGALSN